MIILDLIRVFCRFLATTGEFGGRREFAASHISSGDSRRIGAAAHGRLCGCVRVTAEYWQGSAGSQPRLCLRRVCKSRHILKHTGSARSHPGSNNATESEKPTRPPVIMNYGPSDTSELLRRRYRLLGDGSPLHYKRPLHIVRGEGVWLYDSEGRRYLDAYNNVPHVGHCHPKVVEAIARQAATLNVHTRYLHESIIEYAERLVATFDPELSMVILACTGSEANEIALRMARLCTGNRGILCTSFAYHGNTAAVAQISPVFPPPEGHGQEAQWLTPPDSYRGLRNSGGMLRPQYWLDAIQCACDSLRASGQGVAGMIFDTIFSSEGSPVLPREFIADAADIVRRAGGLYIADEVQPGFGRMGSHMWGYEHYGVVPDIVTLGKPMANGHPISGVVARASLASEFAEQIKYFNTFAGNPVSCAAANAVLDVLEDEQLQQNAREVGACAIAGLARLAVKHEILGDIRGRGLFLAVELVKDRVTKAPAEEETRRVVNAMRERGVLIGWTGMHGNVLKIRPPMPFSGENADLLLSTLDDVLEHLPDQE